MVKEKCCPEPSELRVYRFDTTIVPPGAMTITVPAGKVLVVNSWISRRNNSGNNLRLLRDAEVVAERNQGDDNRGDLFNMIFPTGIAFAAGESLVIDHGYGNTSSFIYGYETDA